MSSLLIEFITINCYNKIKYLQFMTDFASTLIDFASKQWDLILAQHFPQLDQIYPSYDVVEETPTYEDVSMEAEHLFEEEANLSHQISGTDDSCHSQTISQPKVSQVKNLVLKPERRLKERKQRKNDEEESEFQDVSSERGYLKHKGKKISKHPAYPTKNFLPNFKMAHFEYLGKILGSQFVDSIPFARDIRTKSGISLIDYETLYKIPQFEQTFKMFFSQKVLYRNLLLSRSTLKAKLIHIKKLHLFQKAFTQKQFTRIN